MMIQCEARQEHMKSPAPGRKGLSLSHQRQPPFRVDTASLLPTPIFFKPCTMVQVKYWPECSTAILYYSDFHCCLNSAVTKRHKNVSYYHYLTYLPSLVGVLLVCLSVESVQKKRCV